MKKENYDALINSQIETIERLKLIEIGLNQILPAKIIPLEDDDLMTWQEACEYLGIKNSTINNWGNSGKIPYVRLRGSRMYSKAELLKHRK